MGYETPLIFFPRKINVMATDEVMKSYFARFISHEMMFMIFSSEFHGIFTNLSFIVILSFKSPLKFWKQLWLWFLVVAINMQSLEHGRYYQSLIFLFKCIKRNRADYIPDLFEPRILRYNEWFSSNRTLSYAHRIMGSPGGKHCKSLQRNVWRGAVSPLEAVSLDRECNILPWFYEKRRWPMLVRRNCKSLWDQCDEIYR